MSKNDEFKEKDVDDIKHFFIINPMAGKSMNHSQISEIIEDACLAAKEDYELYITEKRGDATEYVKKKIVEKPEGEIWRFYACGGDGTLSEVVNGAINKDSPAEKRYLSGIEVGCIPIGTGNDFVRNFTSPEFFLDITKQILADSRQIDCYSCGNGRYGINMVNIGFDCDVVVKADEYKKNPIIPRGLAYIFGIAATLKKNLGCQITVEKEDGSVVSEPFQLVSAANGGFCGGGFHSAPKSYLDDGLLDVSLIKKVSRTKFLRLVGRYKKGTHLESSLGQKVVEYTKAKKVSFIFEKTTPVCIDGEIEKLNSLRLSIMPKAIAFAVPVGCRMKDS